MKRLLGISAGLALLSVTALAESWSGTVVDTMCKGKDLANHTRQCALGCAKNGFGIVTADGKFVKFDEEGNAKTLAALKASKKDKDLKATVDGTMEGDVIHVDSITLSE